MTLVDVVAVIQERLSCGCGSVDDRWEAAREILQDCEPDRWRDWSPVEELVLVLLDQAELLDHGTTIRCSWRTDLGNATLAELTRPTLCACTHPATDHAVCGRGEPMTYELGDCVAPCPCRGFTAHVGQVA